MSSWSGPYCVYVSLKYSELVIVQTQSNSFLLQAGFFIFLTKRLTKNITLTLRVTMSRLLFMCRLIHHHLDAYFPINNNVIDAKLSKQHRQIVLLHHSDVVSRSRLGLHC